MKKHLLLAAILMLAPSLAWAQQAEQPRLCTPDGKTCVRAQPVQPVDNNGNLNFGSGGGGGGGGGDPSWTATNNSTSQPTTLGIVGGSDGTRARRFLTDADGQLFVNVASLPPVSLTGSLPAFASTPTFNLGTAPTLTTTSTITGTLPAFAATPTFNIGTAPTLNIADGGGSITVDGSVGLSGSLPAFAATPTFNIGTGSVGITNASVQATAVPTRTTLTASTATQINPAVANRRAFTVQIETTLTADLFICYSGQTCSATNYNVFYASGALRGVVFAPIYGVVGAVSAFTTQSGVIVNFDSWQG
jgi:hypothetical protein